MITGGSKKLSEKVHILTNEFTDVVMPFLNKVREEYPEKDRVYLSIIFELTMDLGLDVMGQDKEEIRNLINNTALKYEGKY